MTGVRYVKEIRMSPKREDETFLEFVERRANKGYHCTTERRALLNFIAQIGDEIISEIRKGQPKQEEPSFTMERNDMRDCLKAMGEM